MKERLFLIVKHHSGKKIIVGYVTGTMYPSTIANDHEKAKEMFGWNGCFDIVEVSERCHVEI